MSLVAMACETIGTSERQSLWGMVDRQLASCSGMSDDARHAYNFFIDRCFLVWTKTVSEQVDLTNFNVTFRRFGERGAVTRVTGGAGQLTKVKYDALGQSTALCKGGSAQSHTNTFSALSGGT